MATQPHAQHNGSNVLLISTDHWPAHLLGCAGHPVIQTPTLDELARSGVQFTNCYAGMPGVHSGAAHVDDGHYAANARGSRV